MSRRPSKAKQVRRKPKKSAVEARRARLERYATWTAAEGKQFDQILLELRTIDPELWR